MTVSDARQSPVWASFVERRIDTVAHPGDLNKLSAAGKFAGMYSRSPDCFPWESLRSAHVAAFFASTTTYATTRSFFIAMGQHLRDLGIIDEMEMRAIDAA